MGACYELSFGGRPRFFGVNYSATAREKPLLTRVRGKLIERSSAKRSSKLVF